MLISNSLKRLILLTACYFGLVSYALADESSLIKQRNAFLQAESLISQNLATDFLTVASTLKDYPLYPYLQYQWLSKHLDDNQAVLDFIQANPSSRYASSIHNKWLLSLAKAQQWQLFITHYKASTDSELQCNFALGQYYLGQQAEAMLTAQGLWLQVNHPPTACDQLFSLLQAQSNLDPKLIWARFKLELTNNRPQEARKLLGLLADPLKTAGDYWLKLYQQPQLLISFVPTAFNTEDANAVFLQIMKRWANKELSAALNFWDHYQQQFTLNPEVAAKIDNQLALELAVNFHPLAGAKLAALKYPEASHSEWRVRVALRDLNSLAAQQALAALPENLKNQDKWVYWQARVLAMSEAHDQANQLYQSIASHRSYYGFLAATETHQSIQLANQAIPVDEAALAILAASPPFQVIAELLAINRQLEAKRQWWFAINGFDTGQLLLASKLAQRWQQANFAIITSAKASHWDDIELRFPLDFQTLISEQAAELQLPPELIYAIIRQESAFETIADSSAGAKGLMQLMPQTAKQLASQLNQVWQGETSLFKPETNIQLGSVYFKQLLSQFDHNPALAAAAYNAGPHKVLTWLPQQQLPADIWIETIPFKETRDYVSAVLQYAWIYQHRLPNSNPSTNLDLSAISSAR